MDENVTGGSPSPASADGIGGRVEDWELLCRDVRLMPQNFKVREDGVAEPSPNAFADRSQRPSFCRRHLTQDPPRSNPPRMHDDSAVLSLGAGTIRGPLEHVSGTGASAEETVYKIDVEPDVAGGQHVSHAVVTATPHYKQSRPFDKLKIRLVKLAVMRGWEIPPGPGLRAQLRP